MIAVLLWAQAATLGDIGMPSLGTIISGFAGVGILYIIKLVLAGDKKMEAVERKLGEFWTALYGVKDARERSGLVHDSRQTRECLDSLDTKFEAHVAKEEGMWTRFEENITTATARTHELYLAIQDRMERVEQLAAARQALHRVGDKGPKHPRK